MPWVPLTSKSFASFAKTPDAEKVVADEAAVEDEVEVGVDLAAQSRFARARCLRLTRVGIAFETAARASSPAKVLWTSIVCAILKSLSIPQMCLIRRR